jgi:hypothetical protein
VPATFLLQLETELADLRSLFNTIPTLDPGKEYVLDPELGPHVWRQVHPEITMRTAKEPMSKVMVPPTKEHRAEIEKWVETVNVGKFVRHQWFGRLSVKEKSELLGRLDVLSRAVKAARQRANAASVVPLKVGEAVRKFLLDGSL